MSRRRAEAYRDRLIRAAIRRPRRAHSIAPLPFSPLPLSVPGFSLTPRRASTSPSRSPSFVCSAACYSGFSTRRVLDYCFTPNTQLHSHLRTKRDLMSCAVASCSITRNAQVHSPIKSSGPSLSAPLAMLSEGLVFVLVFSPLLSGSRHSA